MTALEAPRETRVIHRACWVAGITMAALVAAAGFRSSTGALLVPLEEDFGWVIAAHVVGAGFAASCAGWIRTGTGDYFAAWMTAGALCLGAAALCLAIPRHAPAT